MVDYRGKLVLAPMVRAGEMPTRLLALKYGVDLVWSPEIIDKKIISCERVVNKTLGTIDYLTKGKTKFPGVTNLAFRTHPPLEKDKLIFQMGTSDPDFAVQAGKLIVNDVAGIDINAGCPKHFSIHAGMGAALLKTPDLLTSILTNLVEQVGKPNNKPISLKIRLLPDENDSLELITKLLKTGISNLTVHCRTQTMRNREKPIRHYFHKIKRLCDKHNVPLIINGGILSREDFLKLKEFWKQSEEFKGLNVDEIGGMIATEAEINPTCFSPKPLHWVQAIKEYIQIAQQFDNFVSNTKYMITRMVPGKSFFYQVITKAKTYDEFKEKFNLLNDDGTKKEPEKEPKRKLINPEIKIEEIDTTKKHKLEAKTIIEGKKQKVKAVLL